MAPLCSPSMYPARVVMIRGVVIVLLTNDDLALKRELGEVVHQQVEP